VSNEVVNPVTTPEVREPVEVPAKTGELKVPPVNVAEVAEIAPARVSADKAEVATLPPLKVQLLKVPAEPVNPVKSTAPVRLPPACFAPDKDPPVRVTALALRFPESQVDPATVKFEPARTIPGKKALGIVQLPSESNAVLPAFKSPERMDPFTIWLVPTQFAGSVTDEVPRESELFPEIVTALNEAPGRVALLIVRLVEEPPEIEVFSRYAEVACDVEPSVGQFPKESQVIARAP
jgi:hypothetical protein